MKKINKGKEPTTLTRYRSSIPKKNLKDQDIYNNFPNKTKRNCEKNEAGNLRKQLLEEQGYICCYCMSKINCSNSKIEHFRDQSTNRNLQIDYQNLFVTCKGNEGYPFKNQHCDSSKGARELEYINLLFNIENDIRYKSNDGTIFSDNEEINREIKEILNLNVKLLRENRKQALEKFLNVLKKNLVKANGVKMP